LEKKFMAGLLLRDLPDILHRKLKARAIQNRRSMAKEVIIILEHALTDDEEEDTQMLPTPFTGAFAINDDWLGQITNQTTPSVHTLPSNRTNQEQV
jgi:plasmid stability protein